jgi:anti-anti-sigma regulatory factor
MVQTISLQHVLQETVATPYCHLVTRATGAAVRGRIEAALATADWTVTLLDFSGVDCLDLSCADEIVAKLLLAAASRDRVVVLAGVREEQRDALEHVLLHHRLAVAARFRDTDLADVIGWTSNDAREAFAALHARGPADPPALAARLTWPLERTEAALDDLGRHRIARATGGVFHPVTLL